MSADLTAIPVTIVSSDSDVLVELSLILTAFGYDVDTSTDWSDEAPWQLADRPGILVFDDPSTEQLGRNATSRRSSRFSYRILIQNSRGGAGGDAADEPAVDDVISRPINRGELLARLRAGVRRLEFERRCLEHAVIDAESGLQRRTGFISQATRQEGGGAGRSWTLLLLQIHCYRQIRAEHGRSAVRSITSSLTRAIDGEVGPSALTFLARPGVIGVQLPHATLAAATAAAESVVRRFGASATLARETRCCPSVSGAVALCIGSDAEEAVQRCEAALSYGRLYGGGKIVTAEQVEDALRTWKQDVAAGVLLRDVIAQDVMEPFPVVCTHPSHDSFRTVQWLRSAAAEGYPIPTCLPVVGQDGQLLGLIDLDSPEETYEATTEPILRGVTTIAPAATLAQLLDAFYDCSEGCLIVVSNGRPLGAITRDALTELFADRVSPLRYFGEPGDEHKTADCAVPLTPLAAFPSPV